MTTRQELLDQWQQRLADAEQACHAVVVPAWSDRIRVKLYRFLLAMYGQTDWPSENDEVDDALEPSATVYLTVAEPQVEFAGKEPRSRAEILQGLRNVKGLSDELAPAGPLSDGLRPDSPVVVASFRKQNPADAALCRLQRAGLAPAIARQGHLWQIYVMASHSAAATAILKVNAPQRTSAVAVRTARQPDRIVSLLSAMFFAVIACVTGAALVHFVFLDWSKVTADQIPQAAELYALAGATLVCAIVACLLFHGSAQSQRSLNSLDCWHDRIFCTAIVVGMFGLSLTSYFLFIALLPLRMISGILLPPPEAMVGLAAGAFLGDLAALSLLWIWWVRSRVSEPVIGGASPTRDSR